VDENSFRNAKLRDAILIAYKTFADLAGKGSLFLVTILAARRLSPESFGIFSLGSTVGWMLAVATDFGIQLHVARAVSRVPADAPTLLRAWLRVRGWTAAGAVLVVAIGLLSWRWPAAYALPIAVFALMYACSGLVEFLHYFYRGLSRSDVESSLTLWQRGGTLVFGLVALAWWPDVTVLAVALLIPVVVTLAISLGIAARLTVAAQAIADARLPPSRRRRFGEPRRSSRESSASGGGKPRATSDASFSVFRRDVWPIGIGIVLSALYFRIDVFLVQAWSGTESVALYNAVFRLVEALRLFPAAVVAVTLPVLCRARDLRPLVRTSMPVVAFAVTTAAVLWMMAGWLIPWLYGSNYAAAVPAFRILLLSFPLLSLNYALTHQLVGWDGQRTYAVLCGIALAVNVGLNARLIPAWSIEGAAWATLATEVFLTAGCLVALGTIVSRPAAERAVIGDLVMSDGSDDVMGAME
jgi:O-antigen/teichoic acid export membrane protein